MNKGVCVAYCVCMLTGCGTGKNSPQTDAPPALRICDDAEIRRDWGADINVRYRHLAQHNTSGLDVRKALEDYAYTDVTAYEKIAEAKVRFKQQPKTPWPSIYAVAAGGHFAFIFFRTSPNPKADAMVISRPLLDASDSEALAGVLAHEMSHPDVGFEGIADHERVDRHAVKLVGSKPLQRALKLILEAQKQYQERLCPSAAPSFYALIGMSGGGKNSLETRIGALTNRFSQ